MGRALDRVKAIFLLRALSLLHGASSWAKALSLRGVLLGRELLLHGVEVGKGTPIEEGQVRVGWQERVGMEIRASNPAFKTLAQSGNSVTRAIASEITLKHYNDIVIS